MCFRRLDDTSGSLPPYLVLVVTSILFSLGLSNGEEPLCIRFTNTVGSRNSEAPDEYLSTPERLQDWLVKSKLLAPEIRVDASYLARALELRDALYGVFSAVAAGRTASEEDLDVLNGELCEGLAKLELTPELGWRLSERDQSERALMLISLSASELLTSEQRARLRECADETCGWVFLDHSKNRSRRWCSMADCGNLAKARRFQARKQSQRS
jgi:predicted RNA-binding Zn ribbon-like protein